MLNKFKNKNVSNGINNQPLYVIPHQKVQSYSLINVLRWENFNSFLIGFSRLYKLSLSASTKYNSLTHLLLFYCALSLVHDSKFIQYLANNSKDVRIPQFLLTILKVIAMAVESRNKTVGYLNGNLIVRQDVASTLRSLKELCVVPKEANFTYSGLYEIVAPTIFFSCVQDLRCFKVAVRHILETVSDLEVMMSDMNDHDVLLHMISNLDQTLYHPTNLEMFTGKIEYYISNKLGIYRFTNSDSLHVFHVNQYTLSNIAPDSINMFSAFLRIFNPTFSMDTEGLQPFTTTLHPGDVALSIENLGLTDAFHYYMSFSVSNPLTRNDKSKHGKVIDDNDNAPGNQDGGPRHQEGPVALERGGIVWISADQTKRITFKSCISNVPIYEVIDVFVDDMLYG